MRFQEATLICSDDKSRMRQRSTVTENPTLTCLISINEISPPTMLRDIMERHPVLIQARNIRHKSMAMHEQHGIER